MPEQTQVSRSALSKHVISEVDLLNILNVELPVLNQLRLEKGFPVVRLNQRNRVYLVEDIVGWLKEHRSTA